MSLSLPSRRWEIDALRGLMLVLMMVTHLPTRLTAPMGQPLGFVSAAEGFVLLSAYMAGLVYGRLAWRRSEADMRSAFVRRALKLYGCQVAALLFLFTVIAFIGMRLNQPAVTDLQAYYLQEPASALVGALLLIYQPPLLDILPLYVLFMLASPWVIALARRVGWLVVAGASTTVWLLTQFGLSLWLYEGASALLPVAVPYRETGAFSIWAWQLLWVAGLWLGVSRQETVARAPGFPPGVVPAAVIVALSCLIWRHVAGQVPFGTNEMLNLLFDKWQLGPLRLVNLAALVVLAMHYGPALARRLPRMHWLETLGAASLTVFCAHLVLVLVLLGLLGADYERAWSADLLLLSACLLVLYGVARARLWIKRDGALLSGLLMPRSLSS